MRKLKSQHDDVDDGGEIHVSANGATNRDFDAHFDVCDFLP